MVPRSNLLSSRVAYKGKVLGICNKMASSSKKSDSCNQAKDHIIELLRGGSSLGRDIYVVAIVGISESGKRTLHHLLFDDAGLDAIFNFKAWISVGNVFDVLEITKSISKSTGYFFEDKACDLNSLQSNLFKRIAGKRFLIVLDDIGKIYTEASWQLLLLSLRSAAKGSCVVVTTNYKDVANFIHPILTLHLRQPLVYAFFDAESVSELSHAQQDVLKKISCELESLVDFFDARTTVKQKEVMTTTTSRFIKEARLSFSALNQLVAQITYAPEPEVKAMKKLLDSIARDYAQFDRGTVSVLSANQTQAWSVQTAGSHIITDVVIGRDQDRDFIVSKLSDKSIASQTLSIASIVGIGGVGKTTLARYVYNDEGVKRCFDLRFWVSATNDFAFEVLMSHTQAMEDIKGYLPNFRFHKFWEMIQHDERFASFCKITNFMGDEDFWTRIEKMKQKRSLHIFELENIASEADALAYNLKNEEYLDELVLEWSATATSDDREKATTVLTALKPHSTLIRLTIKNYQGTILPDWVGDSRFCCLTALHLCNFPNCVSLPPLGELRSLVYLSIKKFNKLETVGPEFCGDISSHFISFQALKILHFEDLPEWQTWVASEFEGQAFPVLQELYLIECSQLAGKLPHELPSLKTLEILDCEQLNILLPQLPRITKLKLQNCELVDLTNLANLSSLTTLDLFFDGENSTFVPNLEKLTSLTDLRIAGHHNLCNFEELQFPCTLDTLFISQPARLLDYPLHSSYSANEVLLPSLHILRFISPSLTSLSIGGFKDLGLPQRSYMSLQYLSIHDCYLSEPSYFPLGDFVMLEYLEIKNCFHLESFEITSAPGHETCLPFLNELSIDNCPHLLYFPTEGFAAPYLRTLSITNCKNLLSFPEGMHTSLTSLHSLSLKDCPDLDSFPKGGLPLSLQTLRVTYCRRLTSHWKQWKLQQLVSLTLFEIHGCEEVECFPPEGWLPKNLTTLMIAHFPALAFLIGEALQQLTSLQELEIMYCQHLCLLPEEGMPSSLKYLGIHFCPLLKERCQRETGEDWPKISHLHHVNIDFQDI